MVGRSRSGSRDAVTVSFGAKFARSDQFRLVFREGMALVEAAATYLDGEGRKEARKLRPQHSVSEGELTPEQALEEQRKIKLPPPGSEKPGRDLSALPPKLRDLITQSLKLQDRVVRLDEMLGLNRMRSGASTGNPLQNQMSRLEAAFGAKPE